MSVHRSLGRALGWAAAVPLLVALGSGVLALPGLTAADVLAIEVAVVAGVLALLAGAGAALSREPIATRLGLGPGRLGGRAAALAVLGLLGLSHAAEALLRALGLEGSPGLARLDAALAGLGPRELALPLVALALGAAAGEELFFRGLLQRGLERRIGAAPAIGLAAIAFGAAHGDPTHGAAAVLLGLYLGALAHAAGSIRAAIAAHCVNNAVAVVEIASGVELPAHGSAALAAAAAGLALAGLGVRALRSAGPGAPPPFSPERVLPTGSRGPEQGV